MPISFRFRLIPFIACLLLISLGIALAQWQTHRAEEKEMLAVQLTARQHLPALSLNAQTPPEQLLAFRKLQLNGQLIREWPLYLDNRPLQGKAGVYVLMPLKLAGSSKYVLVARGWHPRNARDRMQMPVVPVPAGQIVIEGMMRDKLDRVMQLGQAETVKPGSLLQNVDVAALAKQTGWDFYPFVVEQTSAFDDGLSRDWPMPSAGADKHRGYAFQWYALALMAFLFFVVTGFRRGKN
ncbi:SURF1 family protein [Undibacterium pigrum]|uniref:SURF1-like protein n=1 Tax=Undibacterium pigrum TaxID=401470 RepID=A0A318JP75_9BURK|nr:SURF1 family protein [Undibacterium pigrum]PXX42003.1 cytochrome oxidase assembly protein ShyY1 [Undibacterium pigrum]